MNQGGMELLIYYRHIMNHIHFGGSIWYDRGRFNAYAIIALIASDTRAKG